MNVILTVMHQVQGEACQIYHVACLFQHRIDELGQHCCFAGSFHDVSSYAARQCILQLLSNQMYQDLEGLY